MTDSSEVGRYGTLRLLKRHEPETTVAFFPIDDEMVTFGRSKQCSVRLYYDCVSELHCTLQISEEHKAFLLVQGTNGLLVDGCQVHPSSSPGSGPTTVPLTNGSEIEIYKKRFRFEYPPKEIRAALLATPRNSGSRRSLRMSMIRSAQVFTPRADNVNRASRRGSIRDNVDWEALRSPVKVPSQDGAQEEMMLVEGKGDDVLVVEEEKDIIVLEQVEDSVREIETEFSPSKSRRKHSRSVAFSIPTATPPPKSVPVPQSARGTQYAPHTPPTNRRRSAPSLHRAVVLRSAQLAFEREQAKLEEELEEDEVEASVSPERELGPFEFDDEEIEEGGNDIDQPEDEEYHPSPPAIPTPVLPPGRRMSVFRASLDAMRRVIPVPFSWKVPEEVPLPNEELDEENLDEEALGQDDEETHDQDIHGDELGDSTEYAQHTPVRRHVGSFMTPQTHISRPLQRVPVDVRARASVGGEGVAPRTFGGAQRVRVVPAWKVQDIILSEPEKPDPSERKEAKREIISEEERQAIMARRKSALHTPTSLPMPGPRSSAFPPPPKSYAYTPGEDSDEDAETMLEKMRQKMANVRRKSEARRVRMSSGGRQAAGEFSLLAAGAEPSNRDTIGGGITEETLSQMQRVELGDYDPADVPREATGPHPRNAGRDDIDFLDAPSDDEDRRQGSTSGPNHYSLTPRFDGVREMFRQPRQEPKTPAFTGFRKLFDTGSDAPSKTPSLRGIKEMFKPPGFKVPATPHMNLGDMFDDDEHDDETAGLAADSQDERVDTVPNDTDTVDVATDLAPRSRGKTKRTPAMKSEDEDVIIPTLPPEKSTRGRKAAAPSTKRTSRKKEVQVEEIVEHETTEEQQDEDENVEPALANGTRRSTKRSAKNITTPAPETAPPAGSRGTSRSTKKVAAAPQGTSRGMVVHKTAKGRAAKIGSDEELPTQSGRTTKTRGKGKGVVIDQQAGEAEVDQEDKGPAKIKSGSGKTKNMGTSDEEVAAVPSRRGRATKAAHARDDHVETNSAPKSTKGARRADAEDLSDGEGSVPAKYPKTGRRAGTKATDATGDEEQASSPGHSEEDVTAAPSKGTVGKKGAAKMTPALPDNMGDEKENSANVTAKPSGKAPAVRNRRTAAVTSVDAVDVPARRTRSKK